MTVYMLDTNICSFIMRHQPVVVSRLMEHVTAGATIAISAITYCELRDGALGPKASPKHTRLVDELAARLDIYAWDAAAVDKTATIRAHLRSAGTPISVINSAIAGHALAAGAVVVTNNTREFSRVQNLRLEDWTL